MLIKKSQAKKFENTADCTVWEYDFPTADVSHAIAKINGRYPAEKRVKNLDCAEIYYVISGSGVIHSEKGDFELNEGDGYYFEKGEKYWVEGTHLTLALVNAPKWTPEQHVAVE